MEKPPFRVVLTTCPDARSAGKTAKDLVRSKLAACVTLVPRAVSYYHWEGKLERTREIVLIIKTRARVLPVLMRRVKELHSYATPEIVALPIVEGDRDYLAWLGANTLSAQR